MPPLAMAKLEWRGEITPKASVTFELVDAGRARMLPGAAFAQAFDSAKGDADGAQHLEMILVRAQWTTKNQLTVPRYVSAHVLETGEIWGPLWVWAETHCLELWSEARRLRQLSKARIAVADHLPS